MDLEIAIDFSRTDLLICKKGTVAGDFVDTWV